MYVKYKCTICRRTKTLQKDDTRFIPDHCTITKGCLGKLHVEDTTALREFTSPVAGLDDWYPRGESKVSQDEVIPTPDISLATSSSGGLVLAVPSTNPSTLPDKLLLAIEQRQISDVPYQHYAFKVVSSLIVGGKTVITGRDINGKNARFDQVAINENRVIVRLNGVEATDFSLAPNQVTFSSALPLSSSVDVIVYDHKRVIEKAIVFTRNNSQVPSLARGSWSNINFVIRYVNGVSKRCYLYGADSIGSLTTGTIKITGNTVSPDAFFLLAAEPFESVDRYLNFVIEQSDLIGDFNAANANGQITVKENFLTELYPPLTYEASSLIGEDLYTASSSSEVITDTNKVRKNGKIILGPV